MDIRFNVARLPNRYITIGLKLIVHGLSKAADSVLGGRVGGKSWAHSVGSNTASDENATTLVSLEQLIANGL